MTASLSSFAIVAPEGDTMLVLPDGAFTARQRAAIAHIVLNRGVDPLPTVPARLRRSLRTPAAKMRRSPMPCYVDEAIHPFGRMLMCHLWADTEAELLAMVDRIKVDRKWIQGHATLSHGYHRRASWVHFDIAKGKRALAIRAGAIETDRYGPSRHVALLQGNRDRVATIDAIRARAQAPW